ncbi:MAG: aminopeptidase [Roseburia sp.]|nr:aminopeptidase [Roseburia sp.]
MEERLELAAERIRQIAGEALGEPAFAAYFQTVASFLLLVEENYRFVKEGRLWEASLEELQSRNNALYEDILPEFYEKSFANPTFAVQELGEKFGSVLAFLYTEMRSLIGFAYEGRLQEIVIRAELFLEIYTDFAYEWQENHGLPEESGIRDSIYWFVSDYADVAAMERTGELVTEAGGFAAEIIRKADWEDVRYLYAYGEYVSENELKMARFMAGLSQDIVNTMADTYTEGYRIGFETAGKDLSKKKIVDVRYRLGFERMVRRALENFEKMGLKPAIYRNAYSILHHPSIFKSGFYGGEPNRQYDFDHKDDKALFLDKNYVNRRLEVSRTAFEAYKAEALSYAGPAVIETFGEKSFEPRNKEEAFRLSQEQNSLWLNYRSKAGELQRNYIPDKERSFTIIAFPVPEVGEVFEELFYETIRINTLDYKLYQGIQQTLINALDQAAYCEITGMQGNRTRLKVQLHPLQNPEKETNFENCVADVNIPVGEVFTSPVLKGTKGVLHVTHVFLNGLEYHNLVVTFEDGMIKDYSCDNFEGEEENRVFIRENILFRHASLPMGEFAIGTNTTAYAAARRLQVEDKLPILIAEKMGPHFAVGDTCYSHEEEICVYNPDGKEVIARDNEVSLLRNIDSDKAYFNCHTDITIPYDELGELSAVRADGSRIPIIREGRFVLPGTEKLNEAFEVGEIS